jgi:hypothetical protein
MTKRLVMAGLLVGTMLFALSGCEKQSQVNQSEETLKTQAEQEAQAATETKKVEEIKEATKEVQKAVKTKLVLRINCGATEPYTDKAGNTWLADQSLDSGKEWGAIDGLTVDRGDISITGTDAPKIYQTERYSMDGYKFTVPDGKYTVRLHFAETYDGIMAEGERVFSVSINGQTVLKDFDPFKEAGGYQKPVVKTVDDVAVTNGQLDIGFTVNIQNPEINGIEILSK